MELIEEPVSKLFSYLSYSVEELYKNWIADIRQTAQLFGISRLPFHVSRVAKLEVSGTIADSRLTNKRFTN
jgi:hypothetical protein